MKSLYQFRLLDELKASDTQVRISQLIGRKNEDGSLKDVEFQKETVVLQNGDGSVFEMAFASASGGMLTFHKRGLNENNPPVEIEHNKKTWGNGTKCYVTAGAGDFIDKDEPGVWNGKQTFEGGIIVKGDTAFDGQIDAKRGVKNPTFATKEEASSFFSDSEKVEGLLVNIKGNTYRWNSITKSWEMLGLADINQEKVQENSTKISTLEEKMTTAEGQISQLVEAGTPSYLGITGIVGEKYTMEDTLFLQKTPTLADSTIAINVGDTAANKEQHIQRISSGESSNQLKLKMDKFGAPTTNVIVEVRKGIKVDVSEKEAYWYGGDELLASASLPYTTFQTEGQEITVNLNQAFQLPKGELYSVVVKQENGIVNAQNFYRLYCDSTQYSEAFSVVAVNGSSRVRSKLMPYCVSEGFVEECLSKKSDEVMNIEGSVPIINEGAKSGDIARYETKVFHTLTGYKKLHISFLGNVSSSEGGFTVRVNGNNYFNGYSLIDNDLVCNPEDVIQFVAYNSGSSTTFSYQYLRIFNKASILLKKNTELLPRRLVNIGEMVATTLLGLHTDNSWKPYEKKQAIELNLTMNQYKINTQRVAPSDGFLMVNFVTGMRDGIQIGDQRFNASINGIILPVFVKKGLVRIGSGSDANIKLLYFIPL